MAAPLVDGLQRSAARGGFLVHKPAQTQRRPSMKNLKFVDEAIRAERKAQGPTESQAALAKTLDDIGNWPLFVTWTFKPNDHEAVVVNDHGQHVQNPKVKWCGGKMVLKSRTRNGGHKMGVRSPAPGWSADKAMKQIIQFTMRSPDLANSRWFNCVEPHKFRDCYHGHGLFANALDANWEAIAADWKRKYGRFQLEKVRSDLPMKKYLAKMYVGKEMQNKDFRYSFSRNCRRPKRDENEEMMYVARMQLFKSSFSGGWMQRPEYNQIKKACSKNRLAA